MSQSKDGRYRRILHDTASTRLPDFPKGPDEFYVAILPHEISVKRCQWADFLWLKVKGKTTIEKVQKVNGQQTRSNILLVDGRKVVPGHEVVRILNHYSDGLIALWSILDDGSRVPLKERSFTSQNKGPSSNPSSRSLGKRPENSPSFQNSGATGGTDPKYVAHLKKALNSILKTTPDFKYQLESWTGLPTIKCSDCPTFTARVAVGESIRRVLEAVQKHVDTERHTERQTTRTKNFREAEKGLADLERTYPGHTIQISPEFGFLTPRLACSSCKDWRSIIRYQGSASEVKNIVGNHLKACHPNLVGAVEASSPRPESLAPFLSPSKIAVSSVKDNLAESSLKIAKQPQPSKSEGQGLSMLEVQEFINDLCKKNAPSSLIVNAKTLPIKVTCNDCSWWSCSLPLTSKGKLESLPIIKDHVESFSHSMNIEKRVNLARRMSREKSKLDSVKKNFLENAENSQPPDTDLDQRPAKLQRINSSQVVVPKTATYPGTITVSPGRDSRQTSLQPSIASVQNLKNTNTSQNIPKENGKYPGSITMTSKSPSPSTSPQPLNPSIQNTPPAEPSGAPPHLVTQLGSLKQKYPNDEFTVLLSQNGVEGISCQNCSRTFARGATLRSLLQHLKSKAHKEIVNKSNSGKRKR